MVLQPLDHILRTKVVTARFGLREFGRDLGKGSLELHPDAAVALQRYGWPGNVRELRNLMERAAVLAADTEVDTGLLVSLLPTAHEDGGESLDLAAAVAEVERRTILRALAATDDHKPEAAALLGIGERTLWTKLKKHGL